MKRSCSRLPLQGKSQAWQQATPTIWCQTPAGAKPSSFAAEAAAAGCTFGTVCTRTRSGFVYCFSSSAAVPKRESWGSVQHYSSTLRPAHAQDEKLDSTLKLKMLVSILLCLNSINCCTEVFSHEAGFAAKWSHSAMLTCTCRHKLHVLLYVPAHQCAMKSQCETEHLLTGRSAWHVTCDTPVTTAAQH